MGKIKVTQVRSAIGRDPGQQRVLTALGLRKLHQTVTHENTPMIRGMVKKIIHLVAYEETE